MHAYTNHSIYRNQQFCVQMPPSVASIPKGIIIPIETYIVDQVCQ